MPGTAAARGAEIRTRTNVRVSPPDRCVWELTIRAESGAEELVRAKVLVNAGGPWVSQVLGEVVGRNDPDKIRMVRAVTSWWTGSTITTGAISSRMLMAFVSQSIV